MNSGHATAQLYRTKKLEAHERRRERIDPLVIRIFRRCEYSSDRWRSKQTIIPSQSQPDGSQRISHYSRRVRISRFSARILVGRKGDGTLRRAVRYASHCDDRRLQQAPLRVSRKKSERHTSISSGDAIDNNIALLSSGTCFLPTNDITTALTRYVNFFSVCTKCFIFDWG